MTTQADADKVRATVRWLTELHQLTDDMLVREHLRQSISSLCLAADVMDKQVTRT